MIERLSLLTAALLLATALSGCAPPARASSPAPRAVLTAAAAADLQFALTEIAERFEAQTGHKVTLAFGSTGQLAQQIEHGAPYDLFAAANIQFVDDLAQKGLIIPESVALYARGRIVLAVNHQSGVRAAKLEDLTSAQVTRIAIANPDHAPYGLAAQQALESAGVWDAVRPKLVLAENVRQALQFVQTGDAPVGIVALSVANVPEVTYTLIDAALHRPLDQALGVVSTSKQRAIALDFARFINGEHGRPIMRKYGFVLPGEIE
ncbi:MAG: molybdate ABC transporter substrate-binding protein [Candidatus Roseilinea sp.]|nr:MAG: molybdate ABC transporter substrate-binding protein [Candidatus Roseilinea sp.]